MSPSALLSLGIFLRLFTRIVSQTCDLLEDEKWVISSTASTCYYFSEGKGSFKKAEDECQSDSKKGILAVIKSEQEWDFVLEKSGGENYWIGLQKTGQVWAWKDGTPLQGSFLGHWYNGQNIDGSSSGKEPGNDDVCAFIRASYIYGLVPFECENTERKFICSKEPIIIPPPATVNPNVTLPTQPPPEPTDDKATIIGIAVAVVLVVILVVVGLVVYFVMRKRRLARKRDASVPTANGTRETTFTEPKRETWHHNGVTIPPMDVEEDA